MMNQAKQKEEAEREEEHNIRPELCVTQDARPLPKRRA